jgi:hypothetical protein
MSEAQGAAVPSVDGAAISTEGQTKQPEIIHKNPAPDYRGTKHRLKVDQQELELDYDEVIKLAQKGRSADSRFKEAAAAKKEADAFLSDPWGYLKQKGTDPYEVAESLLLERMKYDQLSDEQKEALHARMEADELKRWKEEREKADKDKELTEIRTKAIQEIDSDIAEALKSAGRKPTPRLIARIAENLMAHLEKGGDRVSAKDILGQVQSEYRSDLNEYLSQMTPDQLREVLPKDLLDGLRRQNVEQAMQGDPARSRRRVVSTEAQEGFKPKKRMSWDEAFKEKEKRWIR